MVGKINYVFTALSNFLHVLLSVVGWGFFQWIKELHKYNNVGCANITSKFGRNHMF